MNLAALPVATLLRALPDRLHAEVFTRLVNHLLRGQYVTEQLADLDGKRLALTVTDTATELVFRIEGNRLKREPGATGDRPWDVRIRGTLEDYWLLASRREDPDTLFFNRQLSIEGETETGLYIKNMLDALDFDWDAHLEAVLGPRLAGLAHRIGQVGDLENRFRRRLNLGH